MSPPVQQRPRYRLPCNGHVAGGEFQIEPDASSASYFHAVNALFPSVSPVRVMACQPPRSAGGTGWQIDAEFPRVAPTAADAPAKSKASAEEYVAAQGLAEAIRSAVTSAVLERAPNGVLRVGELLLAASAPAGGGGVEISRKTDLGDSIMTAVAIAPLAASPFTFSHLGVLRKQECERVHALRDELTKCGARVTEAGDVLDVQPSPASSLGNATICTYHDHRMAMCFATLGLAVHGLRIEDPSCVRKTVPSFFQILAAPPPQGLGVEIWEVDAASGERTRRLVEPDDLFAAK